MCPVQCVTYVSGRSFAIHCPNGAAERIQYPDLQLHTFAVRQIVEVLSRNKTSKFFRASHANGLLNLVNYAPVIAPSLLAACLDSSRSPTMGCLYCERNSCNSPFGTTGLQEEIV